MEAFWSAGPMTVDAIREAVADQGWGEATVRTLIQRLLKRKALRSERRDGRGLLDRLFEGRLASLVAHFAESGDLSAEDQQRLRELVERLPRD